MSMMQQPLLISSLIEHAIVTHPNAEIVSRQVEGGIFRYTYGQAAARAKQLANALTQKLSIKVGDRIGTLAWNTYAIMNCILVSRGWVLSRTPSIRAYFLNKLFILLIMLPTALFLLI